MRMDDNMAYMLMEEEVHVEEAAEDEVEELVGIAGIILAGAELSRLLCAQQRNTHRLYLTQLVQRTSKMGLFQLRTD